MQFSLRSIFLCVTLMGAYCDILLATSAKIRLCGLMLVSAILIPAIVGGIIYARGAWRAFWIGCATGALPLTYYFMMVIASFIPLWNDPDGDEFVYIFAFNHCLVIFEGMIVVVVRWLCLRSSLGDDTQRDAE